MKKFALGWSLLWFLLGWFGLSRALPGEVPNDSVPRYASGPTKCACDPIDIPADR